MVYVIKEDLLSCILTHEVEIFNSTKHEFPYTHFRLLPRGLKGRIAIFEVI